MNKTHGHCIIESVPIYVKEIMFLNKIQDCVIDADYMINQKWYEYKTRYKLLNRNVLIIQFNRIFILFLNIYLYGLFL